MDFYEPPRGILTLDGEVGVSKPTKQDGDFPGELTLIVQGGGQRWKLSSEKPGELERWEEVRNHAKAMNRMVLLFSFKHVCICPLLFPNAITTPIAAAVPSPPRLRQFEFE